MAIPKGDAAEGVTVIILGKGQWSTRDLVISIIQQDLTSKKHVTYILPPPPPPPPTQYIDIIHH